MNGSAALDQLPGTPNHTNRPGILKEEISLMEKIKMVTPLVEMDGDEMTRIR